MCVYFSFFSLSFDLCIMFSLLQFKDNLPIVSIYLFFYRSPTLQSSYIQTHTHTHTYVVRLSKCLLSGFFGLCPFPMGFFFVSVCVCSLCLPLYSPFVPCSPHQFIVFYLYKKMLLSFSSVCFWCSLSHSLSLWDSRSSSGQNAASEREREGDIHMYIESQDEGVDRTSRMPLDRIRRFTWHVKHTQRGLPLNRKIHHDADNDHNNDHEDDGNCLVDI